MNALVKWTSVHADVWMIIMVRSAVIAFAVAAFAASRGITLRVNNRKTMFLRCAVGLTAMILYFTRAFIVPKQTLPNIIHRTAARGESEESSFSDILHEAPATL